MRVKTSYIIIKGVRFHAFHGVIPQEGRVGADFLLDLRVGYPLATAMASDNVADTLNYATLYELAAREMKIPSNLLEHVAGRIVSAIEEAFPQVTSIEIGRASCRERV